MPEIKKRAEGINTTEVKSGEVAPNVPHAPETQADIGTDPSVTADYSIPEALGFTEGVTTLGPDAPTDEQLGVDTPSSPEPETIGGLEVDDQTSPVNKITIYPAVGGGLFVATLTNDGGQNDGPFPNIRAAFDHIQHNKLDKKLHG